MNSQTSGSIWLVCSRRPIVAEFTAVANIATRRGLSVVMFLKAGMRAPEFDGADVTIIFTDDPSSIKFNRFENAVFFCFGVFRVAARLLDRFLVTTVVEAVSTAEAMIRGYWLARCVSRKVGIPAAIAVADDRDIRIDAGILQFARRHGIGAVAVNFGKSDPRSDYGRRQNNRVYLVGASPGRAIKSWIAKHFPSEVWPEGDKRILFTPPGAFVVLWLLGARFSAPWSYGGGTASRVAVQNDQTKNLLVTHGVRNSKIVVTGQCSHDLLWTGRQNCVALRKSLSEKYDLDPKKPLLICATPVLGEHNYISAERQRESTEFLLSALASANANVLLSLHPRQSAVSYGDLAQRYGAHILDSSLVQVLPAADAFVAYSSTLEWAQLLGIPAVALEYFDLGYELFANMPGIVAVTDRSDLLSSLQCVLSDAAKIADLKTQTITIQRENRFDGQASARVLDVLLKSSETQSCA